MPSHPRRRSRSYEHAMPRSDNRPYWIGIAGYDRVGLISRDRPLAINDDTLATVGLIPNGRDIFAALGGLLGGEIFFSSEDRS
jgi:hypothetical protein